MVFFDKPALSGDMMSRRVGANYIKEERIVKEHLKKFAQPDQYFHPEARWWLAEGYHTDVALEKAVEQLHEMGFRACEVLALPDLTLDKRLYGWDSDNFRRSMLTIARKATALGMGFSFTSGPDYQPAVPGIDINGDAVAQELNFTNVNVRAGETVCCELEPYRHVHFHFSHAERQPNAPQDPTLERATPDDLIHKYICTVAVRLEDPDDLDKVDLNSERNIQYNLAKGPSEYETIYLADGSTVDVTSLVTQRDGKYYIEWTAPSDGNYVLFTFWRHATAQLGESAATLSYVISHLDKRGPELQKAYWNEHIFTPEMRRIISENGDVDFFQDSLEITTNMNSALWWSEDFLQEFETRRGYSLTPYLPTIVNYDNHPMMGSMRDDRPRFAFAGRPDIYRRVMDDVHMTQTDLYRENYLQPITQWLNGVGVKLRAQASYGSNAVAFEMSLPEDSLDIQETETLEMYDYIDYYRTHSGGVHMYNKVCYSAESGAIGGGAYQTPLKKYSWMFHRLFAGGVNRIIVHGYATPSGPDHMVEWPGYDSYFGFEFGAPFSERWGYRHPYGDLIRDFTNYLARYQTALRSGVAKVDVGILNLMFHSPETPLMTRSEKINAFWKDQGLARAGYTYDFFAPQYLECGFRCEGGLFDAGNTDYRALVVYQRCVPLKSAEALLDMVKKGMPVVLCGDAGTEGLGVAESDEAVQAVFAQIRAYRNVACCADVTGAAGALRSLGILPRVAFAKPLDFYTVIRESDTEKYLFITNAGDTDELAEFSIEGVYAPYRIDCWTGATSKACAYAHRDGRTELRLPLKAGDAALFALEKDDGGLHIVASNANCDGALPLAERSGSYTATLSNGETAQTRVKVPCVEPIRTWNVSVEAWSKGAKKEITQTCCGHTTTEYYYDTDIREIKFTLDTLKPWSEIDAVGKGVSGVGYYTASFTLPSIWNSSNGLIVDLGEVHEMAEVTVNGVRVQCADMLDPRVDVSAFVHPGENRLEIRVSTTLGNQLLAMGRIVEGQKFPFGNAIAHYEAYGLLSCKLVPYTKVAFF